MDQQKRIRPLSPHLQVYKLPLNAIASIVHRITGVILSAGLLLFVAGLLAISAGEDAYVTMQNLMNHAFGTLVLWLFIYALYFHLCHGVRHLIWDAGAGFEREHMDRNIYIELIASLILTVTSFFLIKHKQRLFMDYRTPLAKARGLGSAKAGTAHWWMQRVTAAALIPLSLWWLTFIGHLLTSPYPHTVIWLAEPLNSVLMIAWILAVFYHAGLGLQVVIEDYVHTEWLKIVSVWIVKLTFVFLALAAVVAVFDIREMV